jgi:hypothetical protein
MIGRCIEMEQWIVRTEVVDELITGCEDERAISGNLCRRRPKQKGRFFRVLVLRSRGVLPRFRHI